jgi:hypothetical protein
MVESDNTSDALETIWQRVLVRYAERGFEQLSHAERVFASIMELLIEVDNGGFAQYMFNNLGGHGLTAVAAMRAVGANASASICEEFFQMLPGEAPAATIEERQEQLDILSQRLGAKTFEQALAGLEKRFYAQDDELEERLLQYAQEQLVN